MSLTTRMNVLVYSGPGTTVESVRHALFSLRRLLSPNYCVSTITAKAVINEPWTISCALFVMPGGADVEYCRALNGQGNTRIKQFVRRGGGYLGLCAGGYYGSAKVQFFGEANRRQEVFGNRELAFFPGPCRGPAFPDYEAGTENGARAAWLGVQYGTLPGDDDIPPRFNIYYNGGGVFVDAHLHDKVEILARYREQPNVSGGDAAVVYIKVGEGNVILTGPHPEFSGINLDNNNGDENYSKNVDAIAEDEDCQVAFLSGCLKKLGLRVSEDVYAVPMLTPLYFTSNRAASIGTLYDHLRAEGVITLGEDGKEQIVGENDTFVLTRVSGQHLEFGEQSADSYSSFSDQGVDADRIIDYSKIKKVMVMHDQGHPDKAVTPFFSHDIYYVELEKYRDEPCKQRIDGSFGSFIIYADVMTSTSTILDKNNKLLRHLPHGTTSVATMQVAGRGRGGNAWVSPFGSLLFSIVIRHPFAITQQAPVVFAQYLMALAVVEGIKTYARGFEEVPVKVKWPNDVYAEDPAHTPGPGEKPKYVKIAGILVTATTTSKEFCLVIGCGVNATNKLPTTSVNMLLEKVNVSRQGRGLHGLPSVQHERLLARILTVLEQYYQRFSVMGFKAFEALYYKHWMHTDQIVRLEMEGGTKARIQGITMDHGLLRAEELDHNDHPTGKVFKLQCDGNSFDFFKGLLKTKT